MEEYLTIKELAARIGYHPATVYEWTAHGMPVRRNGNHGRIRIRWKEFEAWWDGPRI